MIKDTIVKDRIEGKIIHRCRDEYGELIISEANGVRALYTGNGVMQSCLRLDQPYRLLTEYSQAMMTSLVFRRRPNSILLIGLGGGSIVNFLLKTCPGSSIDVAEISGQVIRLSHKYFFVPERDPNVAVFHCPGQVFVRQQAETGKRYDLVLVDAFDESGPAAGLFCREFMERCRTLLNENAVIAINLWNRLNDDFPVMHGLVDSAMGGNTLKLLLSEVHGNAILFAFQDRAMFSDLAVYRPEARRLQLESDINFPRFLKYLYWQNFGTEGFDDTYAIRRS